MPVPKGRGKVLRYRRLSLPGNKYLQCEVMEKPGPRGGKTVCHVKTTKNSKRRV